MPEQIKFPVPKQPAATEYIQGYQELFPGVLALSLAIIALAAGISYSPVVGVVSAVVVLIANIAFLIFGHIRDRQTMQYRVKKQHWDTYARFKSLPEDVQSSFPRFTEYLFDGKISQSTKDEVARLANVNHTLVTYAERKAEEDRRNDLARVAAAEKKHIKDVNAEFRATAARYADSGADLNKGALD